MLGVLVYVGILSMHLLLTAWLPEIANWGAFYGFSVLYILTGIVPGYITGRLAVGSGLLNAAIVAIVGALCLPLFELRYDSLASYFSAAAYGVLKPGILCCLAGGMGDLHGRSV